MGLSIGHLDDSIRGLLDAMFSKLSPMVSPDELQAMSFGCFVGKEHLDTYYCPNALRW
jgi:hypothetical protein